MPDADVLSDHGTPRHSLRIGNRAFRRDEDPAAAVLLTAASWCLQQLPHKVVEDQRAELVRMLAEARNLVVEVRAMLKIPAKRRRAVGEQDFVTCAGKEISPPSSERKKEHRALRAVHSGY
jgi:hypothetical protein